MVFLSWQSIDLAPRLTAVRKPLRCVLDHVPAFGRTERESGGRLKMNAAAAAGRSRAGIGEVKRPLAWAYRCQLELVLQIGNVKAALPPAGLADKVRLRSSLAGRVAWARSIVR